MPESADRWIDSRGKRILFQSYWSSGGWKVPREEPSKEDFEYAKATEVMFDPEHLSHDAAVDRTLAARSIGELEAVARAFVASLDRRLVHLRPALASFVYVHSIRPHRLIGDKVCSECGMFARFDHDFSSTNFARLKWGSVPRFLAVEHAFVLERFQAEPRPSPGDGDFAVLHSCLDAADRLGPHAKARDLESALAQLLRSNREERDALIEILVAVDVLDHSRTSAGDVGRIPTRSNWTDGAALWRGVDGVDWEQARDVFGPEFIR